MKNNNNKSVIIKTLLTGALVLYFIFLYIDLFKIETLVSSKMLKFSSIILVFLISLAIGKNSISKTDILLLRIGLFITLSADFFLLFFKSHYILGVGLFCIVQILYNIRYKGEYNRSTIYKFAIIFVLLLMTYIIINNFIKNIDFLIIIALYYSICLLSSVYRAIKLLKLETFPKLNSRIIVLGMVLFLLCDINIAIFNLTKPINISNSILLFFKNLSYISMWLFYLPSQLLLALSGINFKAL